MTNAMKESGWFHKRLKRLDNQPQDDESSCKSQLGMNRIGLISHYCTGFQNFA